jgi:hypothetical protein
LELAFKSGQRGGQRTQLYLAYLALRLSARPDSARRAGATTRLGTGDPEPAKQATTPRAALSSRDPRRGLCLAQGPRAHQGTVISHDSDRSPPGIPGFQSDAAAARRHGSRNREAQTFRNEWTPTGPAPAHGRPGADTTIPRTARSTPKAYRYGPETTTLRRLLPVDASGLKPMHGTTTRKGAGPRRCVSSPRRCSPGTARRGRHLPWFLSLIPRPSLSG